MAVELAAPSSTLDRQIVSDLPEPEIDARVIILQAVDSSPTEKEAEFTSIVKEFSGEIYRRACNVTQDIDTAEELLQETFLTAWQKISEYQHAGHLRGWLMRIVSNKSIDALRKQRRQQHVILDPLDDIDDEEYRGVRTGKLKSPKDQNPATIYEAKEKEEELGRALAELNPKQRAVIELYIEGYKAQKIADQLNISPVTTRTLAFRARQKLSQLLKDAK